MPDTLVTANHTRLRNVIFFNFGLPHPSPTLGSALRLSRETVSRDDDQSVVPIIYPTAIHLFDPMSADHLAHNHGRDTRPPLNAL